MLVKEICYQISDQTGVKSCASCTDWELVASDEEASLRNPVAKEFGNIHNNHILLTLI
jgi:hypothetical protein